MKKLLGMSVLGITLALAGCGGGDSDSSGHMNSVDKKKDTPEKTEPTKPTVSECKSDGNTVYATEAGCTYSIAKFNGGAPQTYVCIGGRVNVGGINAPTVDFNGITITCAK